MKILIVDDSPDDRTLLKTILGKAGFDDLEFADSARTAYEALGSDGFGAPEPAIGVVLMDVMMPDIDGIEACRHIKSQQRLRDVLVIMVTGKSDTDVLQAAFAAGAIDYIIKPYNKFELLARVGAAVSLAAATRDLRRSEKRLRDITANLGEGVYVLNAEGRVTSINPEGARLLDRRESELLGKSMHDIVHGRQQHANPEQARKCPLLRSTLEGRPYRSDDDVFTRKDGTAFQVAYVASPLIEAGKVVGSVTVFQDITERKRAEAKLRLAAKVIEFSPGGIMITAPDKAILETNPAFTTITGHTAAEAVGSDPWKLQAWHHNREFYETLLADLHRHGQWQGEVWNRRKEGGIYPAWLSVTAIRDAHGEITQYMAMFTDITVRKEVERRLEYMATHDHLTGLPNRPVLMETLKHATERARREGRQVAVLFIDLDGFKNVNDSLGHPAGDSLLEAVADRLVKCVRGEDVVARLGGDEFTLVIAGLADSRGAGVVAQKVLDTLAMPFHLDDHEVFIGASIGISLYPDDGTDVTSLVKNADTAMYRAKDAGRNNYQFYTAELTTTAFERLALESNLRRAVVKGELLLYYQPQVSLSTGRIVGVEALLRWRHPELGMISPAKFIPIAERTGLIREIGEWVIQTACAQVRAWCDEGLPALRVAVNLSASQFMGPSLADLVARILKITGLEARFLELEITESLLMSDVEAIIAIMDALKDMGVLLAIDDFGIGYSSLSYLKRFPIDRLKIDISFVQDICDDPDDRAIARAIIALGHSLQLGVIAEGVETQGQCQILQSYGCDEAQGYLYGRPMPAAELATLLRESRNSSAVET